MSASTRTLTVLICDGCGKQTTNEEQGIATGTMAMRLALQQKSGWHFVQAMVPRPEELLVSGSHRAVRRLWDFCGDCGIPDRLETVVDVHKGGIDQLKVTLVGGMAIYGGEVIADRPLPRGHVPLTPANPSPSRCVPNISSEKGGPR